MTGALLMGSSWRMQIAHKTGFRYSGHVVASYNEARLTPVTAPTQTTLESQFEVTPAASTYRYWDYWGSQVTAFDVQAPHDRLTVRARSVVDTLAEDAVPEGTSWEVLGSAACRDSFVEFLTATTQTQPGDEAVDAAREVARDRAPQAAAQAIAEWVSDAVEYVPGSTGVHTSAAEAWTDRRGVCQDFAHIVVGVLRRMGVPARYVSGYLHPKPDAEILETVKGESHAWVEWWAGDWRAFDPTNGRPVGREHVVVAKGRDYADVAPLKGVYSGPAESELFVAVEVTRLA